MVSEESALDKVQRAISDFETFRAADGVLSIRQRDKRTLPATAQEVLDALGYEDLVREVQNLRTTVEQDLIYQRGLEAALEAVLALADEWDKEGEAEGWGREVRAVVEARRCNCGFGGVHDPDNQRCRVNDPTESWLKGES
jgi:hypothetical protein